MTYGARRITRKGLSRAALVWGLLFAAAFQLGVAMLMETVCPAIRDPEYACKLSRLRALTAASPGRPLIVALGSSRLALGFRPDALPFCRTEGVEPVACNLAINGAGPLTELLVLRRLLRDGVRPEWLVVEVHPALLSQDDQWGEQNWFDPQRAGWHDLPLLWSHAPNRLFLLRRWFRSRLTPGHSHRMNLSEEFAPQWLPYRKLPENGWEALDRYGWKPHDKPLANKAEYRLRVEKARLEYFEALQRYRLSPRIDRTLRELLDMCLGHGIRVVLVTPPEGTEFQSWYPPGVMKSIHEYLTRLSAETGVPWADARSWLPDDCFHDGHHLLAHGARRFTERFGREVLGPLLGRDQPMNQVVGRTDDEIRE